MFATQKPQLWLAEERTSDLSFTFLFLSRKDQRPSLHLKAQSIFLHLKNQRLFQYPKDQRPPLQLKDQ
jgi:hypothetical protein